MKNVMQQHQQIFESCEEFKDFFLSCMDFPWKKHSIIQHKSKHYSPLMASNEIMAMWVLLTSASLRTACCEPRKAVYIWPGCWGNLPWRANLQWNYFRPDLDLCLISWPSELQRWRTPRGRYSGVPFLLSCMSSSWLFVSLSIVDGLRDFGFLLRSSRARLGGKRVMTVRMDVNPHMSLADQQLVHLIIKLYD